MSELESERFDVTVRGRWSEDPARDEHGFKVSDSVYLGATPGVVRLARGVRCEWLVEDHFAAEEVIGVASSALAARVSAVAIDRAVIQADAVAELARLGPVLEHVSFNECRGAPNAAAALAHMQLRTLSVSWTPLELLGELPRRLDLLVINLGSRGRLNSMEVIARAQPRTLRLWLPLSGELVAHALLIPHVERVDVRARFDGDAVVAELLRSSGAHWPRSLAATGVDAESAEPLRERLAAFAISLEVRR